MQEPKKRILERLSNKKERFLSAKLEKIFKCAKIIVPLQFETELLLHL